MNYKDIADLSKDIFYSGHRFPDNMDLIVGVPRSGMLAASIVATHRNLPLIDIAGFLAGTPPWFGDTKALKPSLRFQSSWEARAPLVIDDSILTGASMKKVGKQLEYAGLRDRSNIGAVYYEPDSEYDIDFALAPVRYPRIFEWNLMHKSILNHSCVDIDGVLCRDPTPEENDDGPRYRAFLEQVPALQTPSQTIGYLVTSRLERYREETEQWLRANGIRFHHLYMMNLGSAAERRRLGGHGFFKGNIYKKVDASLFIESAHQQAMEIAQISGKSVLSFENGELVQPGGIRGALSRGRMEIQKGSWKRHIPEPIKVLYRKYLLSGGLVKN
ncbi:phosphoribosyltransferase [Thiohalorhabdus methylotrophus]|uniref:Phosphoribosyltransferase n=1 Tax=Thiohalorhabdus methylotrophus TaxID=3242694 RepID=A0ABV4TXY6_9GAMM